MSVNFSTDRKPLTAYSLAGLADIVLLLLVFFLLTSSFIPQFGIQVNLPRTDTAAPNQNEYITVSITSDGTYYVEQNRVPQEELLSVLRSELRGRSALVLRADEKSTVGELATVASLAQALNLRVIIATDRKQVNRGR
ncbi:MAG: biopolymer transporter ExbD [Bacteroidetes bacterium CG12_big_fil_rev_8_21_14_0_65_60_17]|nr:MAG: biopolymer transporter ExbD [Bacteroidetes bacterium CG12_big_fil_rev_8_21_14_0_65_60_17]